jgi:hypothetical protein
MINGGHFVRREAALHYADCLFLSAGAWQDPLRSPRSSSMRDMRVDGAGGLHPVLIRQLAETARSMGLEPGRDLPVQASPRTRRP